jgi:hypothetical protein
MDISWLCRAFQEDCVESFKKESTESAIVHLLKICLLGESLQYLPSLKIDAKKLFLKNINKILYLKQIIWSGDADTHVAQSPTWVGHSLKLALLS